jgi:hypothetical protein
MSIVTYYSPFNPGVLMSYDDSQQQNIGQVFGVGSTVPSDDSKARVDKAIADMGNALNASLGKLTALHAVWAMLPLNIPAIDLPALEFRGKIVQAERAEINYQNALYIYQASLHNWLENEPVLKTLGLAIPDFPAAPAAPHFNL